MSGNDRVTTVDETGRDRADWDRIEQVLLQQPPAVTRTDAPAPPREGERTNAPSGGADATSKPSNPEIEARSDAGTASPDTSQPASPSRAPDPPAAAETVAPSSMTTSDVAAAGERPVERPVERPTGQEGPGSSDADASAGALFDRNRAGELRSRWNGIQAKFVDDPRATVHEADTLVAEVMKQLASTFAAERSGLEAQWSRGDDVSTEDLRQALRRYRSFFDRLLSF